ncbi:MAG TPA: hypothetical protein ENK50_09670 [Sedimenticola sp.]|nr:hypothetical protein [Sedimenticola sp.]
MTAGKVLFPDHSRFFPGQRWVNIGLRTLHLLGVAGLGAGFLYAAADDAWRPYLWLTLASGAGLSLISIWNQGVWLLQLRGQAILLKLLLLGLIPLWPAWKLPLFVAVILISGVISHAPGKVRYYSLYHRRQIE